MVRLITSVLLAALAGCATPPADLAPPQAAASVEPPARSEAWLQVASADDVARIRQTRSAWEQGLGEARTASGAEVRAEGVLLEPDAALPRPAPTPGSYNCRMVRLGKATPRDRAFERFKPFFCYVEVEGDLLTIVKQTGSQRPAGRLWEDDDPRRLIFLGSLALGNEEQPLAYGENRERDMAGVLERIGPFRWRLVIPSPRAGSKLDVFELTPVAEQPAVS
jgi:hypothetical protein